MYKLSLSSELELQRQLEKLLKPLGPNFEKEVVLDKKNRVDFMLDGWAIEVKLKGSSRAIYRQCQRYCKFDKVKGLILITNKSHGFPSLMNGKKIFVFPLGHVWL